MNIVKTEIEGVLIIEPRLFRDSRGYFFESFSEREFEEKVAPILGHSVHFCQDNESMSSYGVQSLRERYEACDACDAEGFRFTIRHYRRSLQLIGQS